MEESGGRVLMGIKWKEQFSRECPEATGGEVAGWLVELAGPQARIVG
jgi:hypothetical protein